MRTTLFNNISSFGKILLTNLLFLSLALFITGCGAEQKVVKDISLTTTVQDGDVWLKLSAVFDLGGMSMTGIRLPISDPYNREKVYGEIFFRPTFDGNFNEVGVGLNLTYSAQIPGGYATLPNGEMMPISSQSDAKIIELAIDKIHSKIYLALDHDVTLFGFAITIEEFDRVAQYVGGANVFLGFNIKGVKGMAGVYTGLDPMQSGLGFFVDLSTVVNTDILNDIIDGNKITADKLNKSNATANPWSKQYHADMDKRLKDKLPSKATQKKYAKILNKMGDEKVQLHYVQE